MIIRTTNNQTAKAEKSYLASSLASGANSLVVKNYNAFNPDWFVQVGETGQERSEIVAISGTPSSGTLSVGTLRYDHPIDTPVYSIKFDQIIFKRSTSGTAGAATALGTVSITPDSQYTQYDDANGSSSYAYKTTFYNSQSSAESNDSAWVTFNGFQAYSLGGMRESVRRRIRNIPGVHDDDINGFINDYHEMMIAAASEVNEDYNLGTANITLGAGTQEYAISSENYIMPVRVWLKSSAGTVKYKHIHINEIEPNMDYSADPRYYLPGDSSIGFVPEPEAVGTAEVIHTKTASLLNDDDDLLPVPMRGYTSGYSDYAVSQIYFQDGKDGSSRETLALAKVNAFKVSIDPRSLGGDEQVNLEESVSFFNEYTGGF